MAENQDRQRDDTSRGPTPGEEEFYDTEGAEWSAGDEPLGAAGAAPAAPRREREETRVGKGDPLDPSGRFDESRRGISRGRAAPRDVVAEPGSEPSGSAGRLFADEEAASLRARWDSIQTEFVDEPRVAVEQADGLVVDVVQRLTDGFSGERARLEQQWDRGDSVSTEDLRVALKRYRAFFDRLLSI